MKNSAVRKMMADQLCVEEKDVKVEFMSSIGKKYEYYVTSVVDHGDHQTMSRSVVFVEAHTEITTLD